MRCLQKIAQMGIGVVCVLHQPSVDIYDMIDELVLLSKGHIVYHGPREEVDKYFQILGFRLPERTNPAEYLIDVISGNIPLPGGQKVDIPFFAKKWREHTQSVEERTIESMFFFINIFVTLVSSSSRSCSTRPQDLNSSTNIL